MTFRFILLPIAYLAATPLAAQDAVQTGPHTAAAPSVASSTRSAQTGGGILAATSAPGSVSTLFTNIATSPTSDVPGLPGTKFNPGSGSANFDRPWVSPNGAHWTIRADTPLATTMDSVLLVDGMLATQEGTPAPFAVTPGNYGQVDIRAPIQDNGDYVFFTNTTEAADDDYIVKVTAGPTYTIIAQESMAIPALPGEFYDFDLDSTSLLNDGRVALRAIGIDGTVPTTMDAIFVIGSTLVAQEGVTIPAGQDAGGTLFWETFDFENQWVSPDGLHTLLMGDLTGTLNDDIIVYDGTVVLQEGVIIAGSGFVSPVVTGGADENGMDNAGRWYARGNNTDGSDWVLRQGTVIARTDDPIGITGEQIVLTGTLSEAQEVPPSGSAGMGTVSVLIDTSANTLTYDIVFTGLAGIETAAHIHGPAAAGANAGVLYALPLGATKRGTLTYAESEEDWFLQGLTYVNVHTDLVPSGAIRAQLNATPEAWDDADFTDLFFGMAGNAAGDYVVAGLTNGPFDRNAVVVLNGTNVILREGDPVDVDGNGLFDDDAFYNTFGNDDFVLLEDGSLYFTATLRDSTGSAFGQGVFVRDGGNLQNTLCYGDGSGTACPCANNSAVGSNSGCLSSLGVGGKLDSTGVASIGADTLSLTGTNMPNSSALYFQGSSLLGGGAGAVFGDGLRCVSGTVIRLKTVANLSGASQYPQPGDPSISVRGLVTTPGTRYYQIWYRNAAAFCSVSTFNLSNALRATWGF